MTHFCFGFQNVIGTFKKPVVLPLSVSMNLHNQDIKNQGTFLKTGQSHTKKFLMTEKKDTKALEPAV